MWRTDVMVRYGMFTWTYACTWCYAQDVLRQARGGAGVGWANNNVQVGVAHRCDATLRDVHLHLRMYMVLRSRCLTSRTGWGWDGVGAQNGTSSLRKLSLVAKRLRNKTARSCQLSCQLSSCTRFLMSSRRWTHCPVRVCVCGYIFIRHRQIAR